MQSVPGDRSPFHALEVGVPGGAVVPWWCIPSDGWCPDLGASACCWLVPRHCSPVGARRSSELAGELVLPPQHGPSATFLRSGEAGRRRFGVMVVVPPGRGSM